MSKSQKHIGLLFIGVLCFLMFWVIKGCLFISAGTHGSIKAYVYSVKKTQLEDAVNIVLKNSTTLYRDSTRVFLKYNNADSTSSTSSLDSTEGSFRKTDYYNDGIRYVTIHIPNDGSIYNYTFQYAGSEKDWELSNESYISIAYARNGKGAGGSEGNGGFTWKPGLKKTMTRIFENEFLSKVDAQLGMSHHKPIE